MNNSITTDVTSPIKQHTDTTETTTRGQFLGLFVLAIASRANYDDSAAVVVQEQ